MAEDIKEPGKAVHQGAADDDHHVLSQAALSRMLGVSVATLRRMRTDPAFPKRKHIAKGTKGWIKGEMRVWLATRPAA